MANLTQVTPGGVVRPDVALKEDLDAVVQTANLAKQQAQETADFLETRVPVGRTINSQPLDQDIVITADSIGTYDKDDIDRKIAAVEAGGYNPVHVNGHLLDQDIILSAGDIGTYSSSEVDSKVSGLVPKTRKVNGKTLDADVTIAASDLNVYTKEEVDNKTSNFVTQDRKINGKTLSQDITLTMTDLGGADQLVPRTFKINNKDMTGVSLDLTADDIGAISQSYVDNKLSSYIGVNNPNGLANAPFAVTDGSFAEAVSGSGFYEYAAGTKQDDNGNTVPTSVSDRPTGSESGRVIILTNRATYDQDGNVVTPASQDLLAFPHDIAGVWFKKSGSTVWNKVPDETNFADFINDSFESGRKGDVLFASADGSRVYKSDRLVKSARIVNTPADLTSEKANPVDFGQIFTMWDRVGMTNASGVDETQAWSYDSSNKKINCTINSAGPTGFVTPERYSAYTLEAQVASTDADDDTIGVILASLKQADATYLLTAERSIGGLDGYTWAVYISKITATTSTRTLILNKSLPISFGNNAFGNTATEAGYTTNNGIGWNTFPNGTLIKAVRNGSSITLTTTQLNSTDYVAASSITLDLTQANLSMFNQALPYGVMAYSQNSSSFVTLQLTVENNKIYDVANNQVWNYQNSAWVLGSETALSQLSVGHLFYNPNTLKQFFMNRDTEVIQVGSGKSVANVAVNGQMIDGDTGMIRKWGTYSTTAGGEHTLTLPVAFPNAMVNVQVTAIYDGTSASARARIVDKGSILLHLSGGTEGSYLGIYWEAIGN